MYKVVQESGVNTWLGVWSLVLEEKLRLLLLIDFCCVLKKVKELAEHQLNKNKIFLKLSLRNMTTCKSRQILPRVDNRVSKTQIDTNCFPSNNKERTHKHAHAELERHTYQPTVICDLQKGIVLKHILGMQKPRHHIRDLFGKKHATLNYKMHIYLYFIVLRTYVARQRMGKESSLHDWLTI